MGSFPVSMYRASIAKGSVSRTRSGNCSKSVVAIAIATCHLVPFQALLIAGCGASSSDVVEKEQSAQEFQMPIACKL